MPKATISCIITRCRRKATVYAGHLHDGDNIIIAGLCLRHYNKKKKKRVRINMACKGCWGKLPKGTKIKELRIGNISKPKKER